MLLQIKNADVDKLKNLLNNNFGKYFIVDNDEEGEVTNLEISNYILLLTGGEDLANSIQGKSGYKTDVGLSGLVIDIPLNKSKFYCDRYVIKYVLFLYLTILLIYSLFFKKKISKRCLLG